MKKAQDYVTKREIIAIWAFTVVFLSVFMPVKTALLLSIPFAAWALIIALGIAGMAENMGIGVKK
jgi:hypothetical protein